MPCPIKLSPRLSQCGSALRVSSQSNVHNLHLWTGGGNWSLRLCLLPLIWNQVKGVAVSAGNPRTPSPRPLPCWGLSRPDISPASGVPPSGLLLTGNAQNTSPRKHLGGNTFECSFLSTVQCKKMHIYINSYANHCSHILIENSKRSI